MEEIPDNLLYGDNYYFTAAWYSEKYPGFPDEYYEMFERFSMNNSIELENNVDES